MKDLFSQFQEQSGAIRVSPHPRAWDRIENKLEVQRARRRLMRVRELSIAAVFLCLVAAVFAIKMYTSAYTGNTNARYSHSLEDLQQTSSSESIYDVNRIRIYQSEIR